jgi:PAS domain S-box-containing protein
MSEFKNPTSDHRRMTKSELGIRLQSLSQSSGMTLSGSDREGEFQAVLHELEVFQIELEMQNRELQESQQALEDSHERYVNLYDFAPVGYLTLSDQGTIKEINLTLASLFGVERKWLIDRSLSPWILGSELPAFRNHLKKSLSTVEKVTTVLHVKTPTHARIPVELASISTRDPFSGETLIRTTITDLTERRRAEEERDRFFELSSDLLCAIGPNGKFKRLNQAWEKLLGYSREELFSRTYADFVHPDDRVMSAHEFERAAKGEPVSSAFQNRYVKKDGSIVWLTWSGSFSDSMFYGVARDTTAETLEKKAIANQYAWLMGMIQFLPIPLVLSEATTGNVLAMSEEARELVDGYSKEIGKHSFPEDCFFADSTGIRLAQSEYPRLRAMRGEDIRGEQLVWHTPTKITHLLVWSRLVPAIHDHPSMTITTLQNINSLKEHEAHLQEAVENLRIQRALREDFVSALSHDLRTPLTSARLGVQLLPRSANDSVALEKRTEKIVGSIDRMDQMICDLLDANRIQAGEKIPLKIVRFDIVRMLHTTLESLSLVHRDSLEMTGSERIIGEWSKNQLRRAMENLINNAVKYGSADHPITVRTELVGEDQISISVHNFGKAITPEEQVTLFEQFKRSKSAQASCKQGWGVGLTLVRGIVEAHGGKITVQSTEALGTTFTLLLPLIVPSAD